ncbi:MAG: hypothetical protein ABI889_07535 [Gemmatimonadota bacterium]
MHNLRIEVPSYGLHFVAIYRSGELHQRIDFRIHALALKSWLLRGLTTLAFSCEVANAMFECSQVRRVLVCCNGLFDGSGRAMPKVPKRFTMLVHERPVVTRLPDMHVI